MQSIMSVPTIGEGGDTTVPSPGMARKQPLPGIRLHDALHDRQACPEFNSFHQGVGQISPPEMLFSCCPLSKRGQVCYIPPPPPQSLNDSHPPTTLFPFVGGLAQFIIGAEVIYGGTDRCLRSRAIGDFTHRRTPSFRSRGKGTTFLLTVCERRAFGLRWGEHRGLGGACRRRSVSAWFALVRWERRESILMRRAVNHGGIPPFLWVQYERPVPVLAVTAGREHKPPQIVFTHLTEETCSFSRMFACCLTHSSLHSPNTTGNVSSAKKAQ